MLTLNHHKSIYKEGTMIFYQKEKAHPEILQHHTARKQHQRFATRQPFSREDNGTPLQYSCQENPMDGGAWRAAAMGSGLSDFTFTFHFHALKKEMATYSSVLAWRIPGTEEPGGLPSMGSHRVGHNWSNLAEAAALWPPEPRPNPQPLHCPAPAGLRPPT